MKTIALTLFAAALVCAQTQSTSPGTAANGRPRTASKPAPPIQNKKPAPAAAPSTSQKAKAQAQVQSIPAGASQVEPNLFRYTDSSGKTWMYRQTPFGISRWEESSVGSPQAAAPQAASPKADPVAITDLGDSVKFEKKTPFGGSSWVRKKSDLNAEEKALVASQVAGKTKEDK
jgi:hypothetical protein